MTQSITAKKLLSTSAILAVTMALSACQSTYNPANNHAYDNVRGDTHNVTYDAHEVRNTIASQPALRARMYTADNSRTHIGDMYLRPLRSGVLVFGQMAGLDAGSNVAVHIHENGSCDDMAQAAGGHFNPDDNPHGQPDNEQSHAGDMPNAAVNAEGIVNYNYLNKKITADTDGPYNVYQRTIVVHAGADDYTSQPSGDAGDRIACGIIETYS